MDSNLYLHNSEHPIFVQLHEILSFQVLRQYYAFRHSSPEVYFVLLLFTNGFSI